VGGVFVFAASGEREENSEPGVTMSHLDTPMLVGISDPARGQERSRHGCQIAAPKIALHSVDR
jgi:hypothetical protein